jgi:hypothetical protein
MAQGREGIRFLDGLREIRRRRRQVWLIFATYIPVCSLTLWAAPAAVPYVAGLWMCGFAASAIRAGKVRCPRCGNHYSRRRVGRILWIWAGNAWTQRCLHCHLPLRDDMNGRLS